MKKICAILCGLIVFAVAGSAYVTQPEPAAAKDDAEVKWAKGIADDFWRAWQQESNEQMVGLLSPELAKGYFISVPGDSRTRISFDSEALSPDRSEVVFKGKLIGRDMYDRSAYEFRWDERFTADYTMRIAREAGGRWSIRYILLTDRKRAGDEKPEPKGRAPKQ